MKDEVVLLDHGNVNTGARHQSLASAVTHRTNARQIWKPGVELIIRKEVFVVTFTKVGIL